MKPNKIREAYDKAITAIVDLGVALEVLRDARAFVGPRPPAPLNTVDLPHCVKALMVAGEQVEAMRQKRKQSAKTAGLTGKEALAVLNKGGKVKPTEYESDAYYKRLEGVVCRCSVINGKINIGQCSGGDAVFDNDSRWWEVVDD